MGNLERLDGVTKQTKSKWETTSEQDYLVAWNTEDHLVWTAKNGDPHARGANRTQSTPRMGTARVK